MVPFQIRKFRLGRASRGDAAWLRDMLDREGARLGTRVMLGKDDTLRLAWT
jgi:poly-gamma-glutamate synthesis protein (capsule biosynthesis protein)